MRSRDRVGETERDRKSGIERQRQAAQAKKRHEERRGQHTLDHYMIPFIDSLALIDVSKHSPFSVLFFFSLSLSPFVFLRVSFSFVRRTR